jgi:hypothetical protein
MLEAQSNNNSSRYESPVHEFSIYGLGGLSNLNYELLGGGTKSGSIGGGAGLGYTFNINKTLGVVTGVEIGIFGGKVAYGSLSGKYEYGIADDENHFKLRYSTSDYEEQQKAMLLSVPLMMQFKTPLGQSAHFYLAGGFKFGFPVNAEATISPRIITTSGEFSYEQVEYVNLEEYGFVSDLSLAKTKSKIDFGFSAALAIETGVRFSLSDNVALYTGAFFDYGLNDIRSAKDKNIIDYQISTPSVFGHNSVLNSSMTDKVNIFSAGLKIRISFGL